MAIGTSKIGVLGGGGIPAGSQTFNSPGTFSAPVGLSKVTISGRGGSGNSGNAGASGNSGNPGNGGAGGGGVVVVGPLTLTRRSKLQTAVTGEQAVTAGPEDLVQGVTPVIPEVRATRVLRMAPQGLMGIQALGVIPVMRV
jgi:hypothetical protein